jgi:LemA protein
MTGVSVLLALLGLGALWLLTAWRGLVAARNAADVAWTRIDVQLRRRHDLVPALVAAVEAETGDADDPALVRMAGARQSALDAATPFARADAERHLVAGIAAVTMLAERHPGLGATAGFVDLQARLAAVEDEIQAARRIYNADVRLYRTRRGRFPEPLRRVLGEFEDRPYFELDHTRERGTRTPVLA